MPDKVALASTRLGKGPDATEVRDQRGHSGPWRRVEIGLAAFKVGSLTHLLPVLSKSGQHGFADVHLTAKIAETAEMLFRLNFRISSNLRFREGLRKDAG
ncbi:hypothetical protein [Bradyrhizobium sp. RT10b]|uniref:hypothetical protein n=1 Tax=Bradyrhizobium sp. RT10b TaxID=3156331 RepID=UPI0033950AF8